MTMTMASRMMTLYAVWILVFLVVVSLVFLSSYAQNDKAYSVAQLPSARTDSTSSSSGSGSSPSASSLVLASLLALLGLLGMVTLIAAVAIKRRRIEMEDADPPTALTVQTWVQIADGDFDVPIAAATTSAPEMPDSYQGWVRHLAPNIQPADHLIAENPMIPPDTPLSKGAAAIPQTSLVKQKMKQAAGVDFKADRNVEQEPTEEEVTSVISLLKFMVEHRLEICAFKYVTGMGAARLSAFTARTMATFDVVHEEA